MFRPRTPVALLLVFWSLLLTSLTAVASDRVTLYGMLHQTDQGGIVLECPQEPGVVYVPFDPTSIMADTLDIEVQVRGETRDSFMRQGKTFRILAVTDVKPLRAEYGSTTVTANEAFGLPGTDRAQVHAYFNKTCYLYERYAVLVRLPVGYVGHALLVLNRNPGDAPDAICEALQGSPLYELDDNQAAFAGLAADTLFFTIGRTQEPHTLVAVNLARQQQVLNASVVPGAAVAGQTLRYRQQVGTTCPEGKTAARPMALDLVTGRAKNLGKATCWP